MIKKVITIFFVLLLIFSAIAVLSRGPVYRNKDLSYGVTFSIKQAKSLSGDKWSDNYLAMLDDLGVRKIRLPAYWDEVQSEDGEHFDYKELDWMVDEAEKRQAEIIMAIGYRLPRWPECHLPSWSKSLPREEQSAKVLSYIKKTVERYEKRQTIVAWQVENEPFLRLFGECPEFDSDFLDKEIAFVKELDSRPVVVTDSGELSVWVPAAKRADIFGTSIYLNTFSKVLNSYVHYPIGPGFFHFKKNVSSFFAHPQKWVVIEMQAEPWGQVSYAEMTEKEKARTMDLEKMRKMLEFGRLSGFREFYLWGVEWWYWEKETKGNPIYWEEVKHLFETK